MSDNSNRKLSLPGAKKGNESHSQPVVESVRPQTAIPIEEITTEPKA